jgi:hypothetical protein
MRFVENVSGNPSNYTTKFLEDSLGNHEIIGDYSVTPVEFSAGPSPGNQFYIDSISICIRLKYLQNHLECISYGDLASNGNPLGLPNGIELYVQNKNTAERLLDFTTPFKITRLAEWEHLGYEHIVQDTPHRDIDHGVQVWYGVWKIKQTTGNFLHLQDDYEVVTAKVSDDFSDILSSHRILIHGFDT